MLDVRLAMSDARDDEDARNIVEFVCPECGRPGSIRVDERMTRLIAGTDVTLVVAPPSAPTSRKRVGGVAEGR